MYGYMSKPKTARHIQIPDEVLKELLTSSELRMLKNRYQIMNLLQEGFTIRQVAEKVRVGTDTVMRVAKMRISAPQRIIKTSTPWIFGKGHD